MAPDRVRGQRSCCKRICEPFTGTRQCGKAAFWYHLSCSATILLHSSMTKLVGVLSGLPQRWPTWSSRPMPQPHSPRWLCPCRAHETSPAVELLAGRLVHCARAFELDLHLLAMHYMATEGEDWEA